MGQIPEFTRTVLPQRAQYGLVDVARQRGASEAAQHEVNAQNIETSRHLSDQLSHTVNEMKLREAQAANTTWVNENIIQAKRDIIDQIDQSRDGRAGNPKDFHKDFDKQLEKNQNNYLKTAPSEAAREAFKASYSSIRASYYDDNKNWENTRKVSMFAESLDRSSENMNVLAYRAGQSGKTIDDVLKDADASTVAGSTFVAPEKLGHMNRTMRSSVIQNYLEGLSETNPQKAKELLKAGTYDKDLQADDLQRLDGVADAGIEKQQAKARATLDPIIDDAIAEAQATGDTKLMPSRQSIMSAYGPERAEKILTQFDDAKVFGQKYVQIATMPAAEINQLLIDNKPQGIGFVQENKEYDALVSAVALREKQIQADPMGYVQRNVPSAQGAFDRAGALMQGASEAQAAPALEAAITEGLDAQAKLGIPAFQQKVLPAGTADQIIGQMSQGTPQERLQQSAVLKDQYGKHWPQVYADLVKAGLSDQTAVMLRMDRPDQSLAAAKLAEAEAIGIPKLQAAIGDKDTVKSVNETVASELTDYFSTVMVQPGNSAEVGRMTNAANALAYQYVLGGKDAGGAAKAAVKDIIGKKYSFVGTARVPMDFNPDLVEEGVKRLTQPDVMRDVLEKSGGVVSNIRGSLLGTPDEVVNDEYIRSVAEKGYFVTAPDEQGVYVFDQTGHTVMVKKDKDIVPLVIKFHDLETIGISVIEAERARYQEQGIGPGRSAPQRGNPNAR